ncbi:alpha-amylase family glycosyl hydrolase [Candidatus Chloroploca mongolica]
MDAVSADVIFGMMTSDARWLNYVRAERSGVSHRHRLDPPDPEPECPVAIRVSVGPAVFADRVSCYYTTGDVEPQGCRGVPTPGSSVVEAVPLGSVWDSLFWGYVEEWSALLPPQAAGTLVRYRIEAWSQRHGTSYWASEIVGTAPPSGDDADDGQPGYPYVRSLGYDFALTFLRRPRTFAYAVDHHRTPLWLRDALIYHIFVDRFHPGSGRSFAHADSLMGFYGGTLAGIIEQLDYIAGLGVNVLWLSPIFPSPSHHGYDATRYDDIEPRLGDLTTFRSLVDAAHQRGMRVLLDYTVNHISRQHPVFQDVLRDPASPYRAWFRFTHYPDRYASFFGVNELPQVDCDHPAARQSMLEAACFWLEQGVDGFRLDYAPGPSHAFWAAFRLATRAVRADGVGIGEAIESADTLQTYLGRFDGCLDFLLLQALRRFFIFGELSVSQFAAFLHRHFRAFPADFVLPSFLDNHDMNRFLWSVRGDVRRLKLAALCQYTLPPPPVLYYGTEVGLSQHRDVRYYDGTGHPEESRLPMLWGDTQNQDLLHFYQRLGVLRRATVAVWRGRRHSVVVDDRYGHYVYCCQALDDEQWLVGLNNSADRALLALPPGSWELRLATETADWQGELLVLPPYGGAILQQRR